MRRFAAPALLLVSACGARSTLFAGDGPGPAAADPVVDAGVDAPACATSDLAQWSVERYRDQGDYERAAVATSGVPWVALKVRGGNIILVKLGIEAGTGITFRDRVEVPDSPVYPVALDVDDRRFVMLTSTGINWNGDAAVWRIDRSDGTVSHAAVGTPPADPASTIGAAVALAGDDVVVAYARIVTNQGAIEVRDDQLHVVQTLAVPGTSFTAVHASASAVDMYVGAKERVRVENGAFVEQPADPAWQVIGGLDAWRVEMGTQFRLTDGTTSWAAAWPHTQVSPPAVVRASGDGVAFSLETELTAVVGHVTPAGLEWLRIESAPDASGIGLGLLPVVEPGRLGVFYLGLEIPHPEQPLRYYGLVCP